MIIDFNRDKDQIDFFINEIQDTGKTTVTIGQLGLIKRAFYAIECVDALIQLGSKSVKTLPDTEFAVAVADELNTFIRKSEETEV